jgi:hypothetical protein
VRAIAAVPLRARGTLHRPEETFLVHAPDLVGDRPDTTIGIAAEVGRPRAPCRGPDAKIAVSKGLFAEIL